MRHDVGMKTSLRRLVLAIAGDAIGLIVAAIALDKMDIDGAAFVIAVLIFTVLTAVLEPVVGKFTAGQGAALQGGSAVITTFLGLLVTALISDGLSIDGAGTWVIATVLVWVITLIAGTLLPRLLLKDASPSR
jgi:uncharacterized membrane protein YvlD (DUF360 family)